MDLGCRQRTDVGDRQRSEGGRDRAQLCRLQRAELRRGEVVEFGAGQLVQLAACERRHLGRRCGVDFGECERPQGAERKAAERRRRDAGDLCCRRKRLKIRRVQSADLRPGQRGDLRVGYRLYVRDREIRERGRRQQRELLSGERSDNRRHRGAPGVQSPRCISPAPGAPRQECRRQPISSARRRPLTSVCSRNLRDGKPKQKEKETWPERATRRNSFMLVRARERDSLSTPRGPGCFSMSSQRSCMTRGIDFTGSRVFSSPCALRFDETAATCSPYRR